MKIVSLLLAMIVIAVLGLVGKTYFELTQIHYEGPAIEFTVNKGDGFARVNQHLKEQGIIQNPRLFYKYAQYKKALTKMRMGTFEIPQNSTMIEILNILLYGKSITRKVTIPEGRNIYDIAQILFSAGFIQDKNEFLSLVQDRSFISSLGLDLPTLEGRLFPSTYQFEKNTSTKVIIQTMVMAFQKEIMPLLDQSSSRLSPNELITLASIVEKETGASFERPLIAGVFYNRLKKGMRLQSDPTTIYGLYPNYSGNLRKSDLLAPTPYNTYAIKGLPVGPICNPGVEAIKATLNPSEHNYLYFVSQNDGRHIFSPTYQEHAKAVDFYQKNRANRVGKSWRDLQNTQTNP